MLKDEFLDTLREGGGKFFFITKFRKIQKTR